MRISMIFGSSFLPFDYTENVSDFCRKCSLVGLMFAHAP